MKAWMRVWRAGLVGLAGTLAVSASGCAASRAVQGRVLPGPAGIATVVQANDPRLSEPGLGGVEIRLTDGSGGMGSVAHAVSREDGSFSLRVSESAMTRRLGLHAESDAIIAFHGTAHLPMDDRRLLVIVQPREQAGDGGTAR